MQRKLIISLLVTGVFAFIGLLVCTEAVAQCPVNYKCKFEDSNGQESPWALELLYSNFPDPAGYYKWTYKLTGVTSGINQVVTLAPVCCPELGYKILSGGQVLSPGSGDPTTNFGTGIYQEQAIKMDFSPSSTLNAYTFYTTSRATELSNTTMQLKVGKALYYCKSIAGPACSVGSPYSPEMRLEEFYIQNVKVKIEWDENSPSCDAVVYYSINDGNTWNAADLVDIEIDGAALVECGPIEGNQKCQRCRFTTKVNPTYTYIKIGGVTYKVCTSGC